MLDLNEEKKFAELKKMCQELKVPAPPEIFIRMQVHDKKGDLVIDNKERGHSWTRNFYNYLLSTTADVPGDGSGLFGAGKMSAKNIAGSVLGNAGSVSKRDSTILLGYGYHNNAANTNFGIVVGTGSTAFNADQYKLDTLIVHGVGSGQLSYVAMAAPVATYASKVWKNTIKRIMNNNSGEAISVAEVALYSSFVMFGPNAIVMFERSVLASAVDVPNGAQLTVTYEISMDFSAID
jgi:hypothetical protein